MATFLLMVDCDQEFASFSIRGQRSARAKMIVNYKQCPVCSVGVIHIQLVLATTNGAEFERVRRQRVTKGAITNAKSRLAPCV